MNIGDAVIIYLRFLNIFNHKLYGFIAIEVILLNSVADTYWFEVLNVVIELLSHTKGYSVHNILTVRLCKFKFKVLQLLAHKSAGSKINHIVCDKHRLQVVWTERSELLKYVEELRGDFREVYGGVNINLRNLLLLSYVG